MSNRDREQVQALKSSIEQLLQFDRDEIYSREEWGSKLTFEPFREDFERLFGLGKIFQDLPFELLPDAPLQQINQAVGGACQHLNQIDDFDSTTASNPAQTVNSLGEGMSTHADKLTTAMAPWISYLAFQKGDVAKNIESLQAAIGAGNEIVSKTKTRIEHAEGEIKKIVQQAQDFAGDRGVTVFTEQFNSEASSNEQEAKNWLKVTTGILVAALVTLVVFTYQLIGVTNPYEWLPRAALVGVLLTAAIWCGKNYRILRHHHSVNRHKANGLKSFLLFRDAADNDETTRNTVLIETTRAIFSAPDSGFIPNTGQHGPSEVRVLDGARTVGAAAGISKAARSASE